MKNVVIFTTPTCKFCHMAKDFFKENNIQYTEHDVSNDQEKRQEMIEKSGQMGVPVILISDPENTSGDPEVTVGFDKDRLSQLLSISA